MNGEPTQRQETQRPPQTLSPEELAAQLKSNAQVGLTTRAAKARGKRLGKNILRNEIEIHFSQSFRTQCRGLTNLFWLLTMLVLYLFDQSAIYLIAMVGALLLMLFGALTESAAASALNVPTKYTALRVRVVRDGKLRTLDSRALVPGDLLLLKNGDMIPADARIIEDDGELTALETPVSGVRSSVRKSARERGGEHQAVCVNMLYAGTVVTGGACTAMVCRIGKQTLLRQIHMHREEYLPPLLRHVRDFCRTLSVVCLLGCVLLLPICVLRGGNAHTVFALSAAIGASSLCDCALSLAMVSFGRGVRDMAKDKLVVRNMERITTLAETDCIMCPKALMFPSKKARLLAVYADGKRYNAEEPPVKAMQTLLKLSLVCSDHPRTYFPFEQVTYTYLKDFCIPTDDLTETWFRMDTRRNGNGETEEILALHEDHNTVVLKGAPENVLSRCAGFAQGGKEYKLTDAERRRLLAEAENLSKENAYLLAIASGGTAADNLRLPDAERQLIFRGFLAFRVAVEVDLASAVYRCTRAGIEGLISTNDPYYTAASVGKSIGLIHSEGEMISSREMKAMERGMFVLNAGKYKVFLEPDHEQWQDVLMLRRQAGRKVLATAAHMEELPLLREADVSAVPVTSSDALRESADLLLLENGFHVLANGITDARALCFRLRWLMQYLVAGTATLFMSLLLALAATASAPFGVQELLFGGVFGNLTIALTVALLPVDRKLLQEPSKDLSGRLKRQALVRPLLYALGGGTCVFLASLLGKNPVCGMLCFLLTQFFYACGCFWERGALARKQFGYRRLWTLFPFLLLYVLLLTAVPALKDALGFTTPDWKGLLIACGLAAGWQILMQVYLLLRPGLLTKRKKGL